MHQPGPREPCPQLRTVESRPSIQMCAPERNKHMIRCFTMMGTYSPAIRQVAAGVVVRHRTGVDSRNSSAGVLLDKEAPLRVAQSSGNVDSSMHSAPGVAPAHRDLRAVHSALRAATVTSEAEGWAYACRGGAAERSERLEGEREAYSESIAPPRMHRAKIQLFHVVAVPIVQPSAATCSLALTEHVRRRVVSRWERGACAAQARELGRMVEDFD